MQNDSEECCSKCKHQITINCHPGNQNIGVGRISDVFGYGCIVFKDDQNCAIFSESPFGRCEMFQNKSVEQ